MAAACSNNTNSSRSPTVQDVGTIEFNPPANGTASDGQMRCMNSCISALDSLSILYRDSFSVKGAGEQTRRQNNFVLAQDRICVHAGLAGGYAEYFWITRHPKQP
jgi:hypothetical protein